MLVRKKHKLNFPCVAPVYSDVLQLLEEQWLAPSTPHPLPSNRCSFDRVITFINMFSLI